MPELLVGIILSVAELLVIIISGEKWDATAIAAILGPILAALGIHELYIYARGHKDRPPPPSSTTTRRTPPP